MFDYIKPNDKVNKQLSASELNPCEGLIGAKTKKEITDMQTTWCS